MTELEKAILEVYSESILNDAQKGIVRVTADMGDDE